MGRNSRENLKHERRWNPNKRTNGIADWGAVAPDVLHRAIEVITRKGGAIRLGYSRDGGAYAIGIYGDGDPYTVYVRPSDDVEDHLRDVTDVFENSNFHGDGGAAQSA